MYNVEVSERKLLLIMHQALNYRELAKKLSSTAPKISKTASPVEAENSYITLQSDLRSLADIVAQGQQKGIEQAEYLAELQTQLQILSKNAGGVLETQAVQIKTIQRYIDKIAKSLQMQGTTLHAQHAYLEKLNGYNDKVTQAIANQEQIVRWIPVAMIATLLLSVAAGLILVSRPQSPAPSPAPVKQTGVMPNAK